MRLSRIFSEGAVLQRDQLIPVWGVAQPDQKIQAELAGKTAFSRSGADGHFLLYLPPLPPGGPWELKVSSENESVTVPDILIGDVWLASGQSNMQYKLRTELAPLPPGRTRDEVQELSRRQKAEFIRETPDPSVFRYFQAELRASGICENDIRGAWHRMDAQWAPESSAVAAWFGHYLQEGIKVPVGLIDTSWGATIVEAWTSLAGLTANPETAHLAFTRKLLSMEPESWDPESGAPSISQRKIPENRGEKEGWAGSSFDDSDWKDMQIPGSWIKQQICGNGAVWVRMRVNIPEAWAGCDLTLRLGNIDKQDITYFNGVEIGRSGKDYDTSFWDKPRLYQIPGKLVSAGENVIAIRGFSFVYNGEFGGTASAYSLERTGQPEERVNLAGVWKCRAEFDWGKVTLPKSNYRPGDKNTPGILFDSLIHPLLRYGIKGVIWYQGESNANTLEAAASYGGKLITMIRDWRYRWEQGDFPFLQVQLANWRQRRNLEQDSCWAELRRQQDRVCRHLPAVHMATAIDIGEVADLHPQNKREVGRRLALTALHHVYGKTDICCSGPVCCGVCMTGSSVRLTFRNADGLQLNPDSLAAFQLGGADGTFCPPDHAEIDGNTLILSSEGQPFPVSVRYAWADNPPTALRNGAGLPAFPFRTDDLPRG